MATNSYIQRDATVVGGGNDGKRLYINITRIRRKKGTPTTDLPIPSKSSDKRQLLPLAGQINDFTITITLRKEDSNIGYTVSTFGFLTALDIKTIVEQYNFLYDTLLSSTINKKYRLYLDWLDKTYIGQIEIDSDIDPRTFTGEIELSITFKEGGNFLSV